MKKLLTLFAVCLFINFNTAHAQNQPMDTLSYSMGVLIAQNLKEQGFTELKSDDVAAAINDVLNGTPKMSLEECGQHYQKYAQAQSQKLYAAEVEAGKNFLAENGKRAEVTTLASGLQYEILTEGTGPKPAATDKVTTHYHGTLMDGTVFDSSVERNQPASFPVNGVIQGWQEALQLMPVGSKWKLYVPHNLAYGERGAGKAIKPFATLVFEVELIKID